MKLGEWFRLTTRGLGFLLTANGERCGTCSVVAGKRPSPCSKPECVCYNRLCGFFLRDPPTGGSAFCFWGAPALPLISVHSFASVCYARELLICESHGRSRRYQSPDELLTQPCEHPHHPMTQFSLGSEALTGCISNRALLGSLSCR